jgi:hypothetical protein
MSNTEALPGAPQDAEALYDDFAREVTRQRNDAIERVRGLVNAVHDIPVLKGSRRDHRKEPSMNPRDILAEAPMDVIRKALTSEDEIAHGEAWHSDKGGLGVCAYCDADWPCRTQQGLDRLLATLSQKGSPYIGFDMDLMGWAVAYGTHSEARGDDAFSGEGDPGPASAFRALAQDIRGPALTTDTGRNE